jgi:hypothetical protein
MLASGYQRVARNRKPPAVARVGYAIHAAALSLARFVRFTNWTIATKLTLDNRPAVMPG